MSSLLEVFMGSGDKPGIGALLKQYIKDAMPGGSLNPEVTGQGVLDATAAATMPVPILGDIAGLGADVNRYVNEPEERTLGNFLLTGAGLLPFVPAMSTVKSGKELEKGFKAGLKTKKADFENVKLDDRAKAWRAQARETLAKEPEAYQRPKGTLLDFSAWDEGVRPDMSAFSNVKQGDPLPRKQPAMTLGRVPSILRDNDLHDIQMLMAKRGQKLGGDFWYNLMPTYRAMMEAGGTPEDFARLVANNYAFSAQTPVLPNIAHASLMGHMTKKGMIDPSMDGETIANLMREKLLADTGKSAMISRGHTDKALDFLRSGKFAQGFDNEQKFSGYGHGLAGFLKPVALDTHEVRTIADSMPESIRSTFYKKVKDKSGKEKLTLDLLSPNEYAIVESLYQNKLAPSLGMNPADFQANRWVGGGDVTGLVSPPIPWSDAQERLIAWNALQRGKDPKKFRDAVLLSDEYLYPYNKKKDQLPLAEILLSGLR